MALPMNELQSALSAIRHSHPNAVAAVFCDDEGERIVASCGELDPFDVDIWGASLAVPAKHLFSLSPAFESYAHCETRACGVAAVSDPYYVVVLFDADAQLGQMRRALREAASSLRSLL